MAHGPTSRSFDQRRRRHFPAGRAAALQLKVQVTGARDRGGAGTGRQLFRAGRHRRGLRGQSRRADAQAGDCGVTGVTEKGAYAPVITGPTFVKLGTRAIARRPGLVSIESLMSGAEDSQRVEITGVVRSAQMSETESNLDLTIASAGYRFHAFPKLPSGLEPKTLIGAKVRLRGTPARFSTRPSGG